MQAMGVRLRSLTGEGELALEEFMGDNVWVDWADRLVL